MAEVGLGVLPPPPAARPITITTATTTTRANTTTRPLRRARARRSRSRASRRARICCSFMSPRAYPPRRRNTGRRVTRASGRRIPPGRASAARVTSVAPISHASCSFPSVVTAVNVTNSDGTITPNPRLIVLLLNVSPTSAAPRPATPRRTAVIAFGMLVSGPRITTPRTASEMCQWAPRLNAASTMPKLPATISATSRTINASRWCVGLVLVSGSRSVAACS